MLPELTPIDDEDSDDGDDADAIAEALLGRKPFPGISNGRDSVSSTTKLGSLEEGQLVENQVNSRPLDKPSQEVSLNSVGQPLGTSLLDRLGPPSQSTSLPSASSSARWNHLEQVEHHPSSIGASPIQSQDVNSLRLLTDDQQSFGELRSSRGQKRAHSPRRRRNHSRSRSPNRSRHSPPPCDIRRRASLSARITLNHGRSSCSLDSFPLDLPPRSKRIARRFSSPSNTSHFRRDPREREIPNSLRYHTNPSTRPRQHPDLHPLCEPVVEETDTIPISNAGSTSKSPSLNSPDTTTTVLPKTHKVSMLVANLPSYYVLTPKRLYEHLTDSLFRQRCQSGIPHELKLYRYARSDCVVGELKFNSLDDARHFTQKVDRIWPGLWYPSKKLPPHSRQKKLELTILEDRQISWPSNYETYSPKLRLDSLDGSNTRVAADDGGALEQPAQSQAATSPHIASSVDVPAVSTSKLAENSSASSVKINSIADCYRPQPRQYSPDVKIAVEKEKNQPVSQPHPIESQPLAEAMSIPVQGLGSLSPQVVKDNDTSLANIKLDTDDCNVVEQKASSTEVAAPAEEPKQNVDKEPTPVFVHNIPENINPETFKPPSTSAQDEDSKSSVMLSELHPSLTWPVLQSHFSYPNRPRHFRIFEPFQVAYGSFFASDRTKSSVDDCTGSLEGCMISFNDTNTARNFCRVLQRNPPFQSVQIRLVDAADIEFVPSASIIRKRNDEDYAESATANDPANQFIQNSLSDFQNQLNWTPFNRSEMQSPSPAPMEINQPIPTAEPQFTGSNLTMQPSLSCPVYPFPYSGECQSSMLGYPQSRSTAPKRYPYNPPSHDVQKFSAPRVPEGFNMTSNDISDKKTVTPQELQDRLKKILQERKAKSHQ